MKGTSGKAIAANSFLSKRFERFDAFLLDRTVKGTTDTITIADLRAALDGIPMDVPADNKKENISVEKLFDMYVDKLEVEDARKNTIRNVKSSKRMICEFIHREYGRLFI